MFQTNRLKTSVIKLNDKVPFNNRLKIDYYPFKWRNTINMKSKTVITQLHRRVKILFQGGGVAYTLGQKY